MIMKENETREDLKHIEMMRNSYMRSTMQLELSWESGGWRSDGESQNCICDWQSLTLSTNERTNERVKRLVDDKSSLVSRAWQTAR